MDCLAFKIAKSTITTDDNINFKKKPKKEVIDTHERCQIRIWDGGNYGKSQCPNKKINDCMCSKHIKSLERMPEGKWWLGLITEDRPENPYHPISGNHHWNYDINGEFINNKIIKDLPIEEIKEDKNIEKDKHRKKRGRPKGSKNKVKASN